MPALRDLGVRTLTATYGPLAGEAYVDHAIETWWGVDYMLESMRTGRVYTLVAEVVDHLVGVATLGSLGDDPVLWKLYVDPDEHGHGVGGGLLAEAAELAAVDHDWLYLSHAEGNERAARFYTGQGFEYVRTEPDRDGWPAQIWLRLHLGQALRRAEGPLAG